MGRQRNRKLAWLSDCKHVIVDKGWFVYRPYLGGGKYGPQIKLAREKAPKSEIFKRYEEVTSTGGSYTLQWLLDTFLTSPYARKEIKPVTLGGYQGYRDVIVNRKNKNGARFGDTSLSVITIRTMRRYLDTYPYPVSANRHVQFISSAFAWGVQRYKQVESNPCTSIKLNKEKARDRYIEDWEFAVGYESALTMRIPHFAPAMRIAYLCRARRNEVYQLRHRDTRKRGIFLERSKGSMNEITTWTPDLREAVAMCQSIYPDTRVPENDHTPYLIHDKSGLKYGKNALDSAWQRVVSKARKIGAELPDELVEDALESGAKVVGNRVWLSDSYTFHDIKAKGVTDHNNHESGHMSEKMKAVYNRKPKEVEATR